MRNLDGFKLAVVSNFTAESFELGVRVMLTAVLQSPEFYEGKLGLGILAVDFGRQFCGTNLLPEPSQTSE